MPNLSIQLSSDPRFLVKAAQTNSIVNIPDFERRPQISKRKLAPNHEETATDVVTDYFGETSVQHQFIPELVVPTVDALKPVSVGAFASVIQIWEGVVIDLNIHEKSMSVKLIDRQCGLPEHTAGIGLDWVVEQDMDLVRPGAVFYWTLYRETKRSTIKHAQEIRFRRLPNWTSNQISKIYSEADSLLANIKPAPIAT